MIPERFRVAYRWLKDRLQGRASHVSIREMLAFLVQDTAARRGLKYIDHMNEEDDFFAMSLIGKKGTLYWPKQDPIASISELLDEQMRSDNWHAYLTPETFLGPDDIAIDCGSSEGLFTFLNYPACRRIIAIEPNPIYIKALEKTFADNKKVTIAPVAVGAYSGSTNFKLQGKRSSVQEKGDCKVEIRRLDDLLKELNSPASFIKADLEGYEMNFLKGARETIATYKPKLAMTAYHDRNHPHKIAEFLRHIEPAYKIRLKGYSIRTEAVMLHAWIGH